MVSRYIQTSRFAYVKNSVRGKEKKRATTLYNLGCGAELLWFLLLLFGLLIKNKSTNQQINKSTNQPTHKATKHIVPYVCRGGREMLCGSRLETNSYKTHAALRYRSTNSEHEAETTRCWWWMQRRRECCAGCCSKEKQWRSWMKGTSVSVER